MRRASMKTFMVYTGNGNDGCSFDHEIEAENMDAAVAKYMEGVAPEKRGLFDTTDGDEDQAVLTVLEDEDGSTAYGGGAFFIVEIYDAETCPRGRY
jgi:hypothetical protein